LIFLPLPEIPGTLRSHSIEVQTLYTHFLR